MTAAMMSGVAVQRVLRLKNRINDELAGMLVGQATAVSRFSGVAVSCRIHLEGRGTGVSVTTDGSRGTRGWR